MFLFLRPVLGKEYNDRRKTEETKEIDRGKKRMMNAFFWGGGFEIMFFIVFFGIFGMFLVMVVRGIGEWSKNNQSPRLTVEAKVVAKRMDVSHHGAVHHHGASGVHMSAPSSVTCYYATFQVESGDRIEFRVNGNEYGMLAEDDFGRLTFQGTRYLGFERKR